jgi:hypothetical protein
MSACLLLKNFFPEHSLSFSHSIHAKHGLSLRAISWNYNELLEGASHCFHYDGVLGVATPAARNLCVLRKENRGLHTALGSFLVLLVVGCILYFYTWWKFRNGNKKYREHIERRQRHAAALGSSADDLDYLKVDMELSKNKIGRIKDYAGLDPTFMGMEEGRPVVTVLSHEEEDEEMEDLE